MSFALTSIHGPWSDISIDLNSWIMVFLVCKKPGHAVTTFLQIQSFFCHSGRVVPWTSCSGMHVLSRCQAQRPATYSEYCQARHDRKDFYSAPGGQDDAIEVSGNPGSLFDR